MSAFRLRQAGGGSGLRGSVADPLREASGGGVQAVSPEPVVIRLTVASPVVTGTGTAVLTPGPAVLRLLAPGPAQVSMVSPAMTSISLQGRHGPELELAGTYSPSIYLQGGL